MHIDLNCNRKTVIDARTIGEKAKQFLRLRAYTLVRIEGMSPEVVTTLLGVSHGAVYKWLARGDKFGIEVFHEKPDKEKKRSKRRRLSEIQENELKEIIIKDTPHDHGYSVILWTRAIVAELIFKHFNVKFHPNYVSQIMKKLGLSPQKPIRKSYRQNPKDVELWQTKTYPEIERKAAEEKATIVWGDECRVCASPNNGTTWAPRGDTPVVKVLDSTSKVNVVGTLDNQGRSEFMVFQGSMNSTTFCTFIDDLMSRYKEKIILILDNASYHKSSETQSHLKTYSGRLEVFFYPSTLPN